MIIKGVSSIPTRHRAKDRSAPRNRAAGLAELTYLEHEKARLERKLQVLTQHQERSETQLVQVQQRIDLLTGLLYEKCAASPRTRTAAGAPREAPEPSLRRAISLEY